MGKPFHELADSIKKRESLLLFLICWKRTEAIVNGLKHFRFAGNDVIVFQILDPFELTFQFKDIMELEDMETGEKMIIMSDEREKRTGIISNNSGQLWRRNVGVHRIDYNILETSKPLDLCAFQIFIKKKQPENKIR